MKNQNSILQSDTKQSNSRFSNILSLILALLAGCLVFAIMQGIHDNYGIMLPGIVYRSGLDYASVSFVIAVGQILYGATQPVFGMLAIKKSNAFVMLLGIILMAVGLIVSPFCNSLWSLLLFFGILLPAGTGALFQFCLCSRLSFGWVQKKREKAQSVQAVESDAKKEKLSNILKSAFQDRTYWCLLIGFSTCGFHISIIETHLFSQYAGSGIPANLASLTLTVYGIFTMLGAVITGFLGQKLRMKNVLAGVYGIRILIALAFIFIPKSVPFAFIATGMLGLTGDATVPPTTGIISNKIGVAKMAVVYGSIFIGHQLGAFASAWLGGILVSTTLGYTALWIVDLCLCVTAAIASFQIRD